VIGAVENAIADGRARVSERELARSNGRPDEEPAGEEPAAVAAEEPGTATAAAPVAPEGAPAE
jgi:hypothetical protein